MVLIPREAAADAGSMNTNNELIVAIDSARAQGSSIRSIRKQKHDPANFYMTRTDGKQVGPIHCSGDTAELNRKFGEAQSYLAGMKKLTPAHPAHSTHSTHSTPKAG